MRTLRNPFRRKGPDHYFPPQDVDAEERESANAAKRRALLARDRVSEITGTIRTEVETLREDRYQNHYAEALMRALYRREDE